MGDGRPADCNRPATERVRRAIADADVASTKLFSGLADIDGIGDIAIEADTARVVVTLPVADADIQESIETDIRDAATGVAGVTDVDVVWRPAAADPGTRVDFIPDVKTVIAVSSGKGGVGKSTVAVNLAAALADAGAAVGLLDADIYGPNAPTLLGLSDATPDATLDDRIVPREAHGVKVMSMAFVVDEDDPVIWRGPMVDDMIKQLFDDVEWGVLDYLLIDLPPGTGDAQLTLVQHLPVTGAVIVTTPQPVAVDDARLGLEQFARYDVPILGITENMNRFECSECGTFHDIFGSGGADELADEFSVPVLGRLPLDPAVGVLEMEADDPPGVSVPLVGRLQLPRTREEREQGGRRPPSAIRDDDTETRAAFRRLASRTAARVNAAVARTR